MLLYLRTSSAFGGADPFEFFKFMFASMGGMDEDGRSPGPGFGFQFRGGMGGDDWGEYDDEYWERQERRRCALKLQF